jgi:hypothetical protein
MSVDVPVLIPMNLKTLLSPIREVHPLLQNKTLQLAVWKVSGDPIKQWDFQSVTNLLLGSWKRGTSNAYNSDWKKWHCWCLEREIDPFSAHLAFVLDFLAWMHFKGYDYRTINVHVSNLIFFALYRRSSNWPTSTCNTIIEGYFTEQAFPSKVPIYMGY